jgi:hypothetical protein
MQHKRLTIAVALATIALCAFAQDARSFTIAVLPDSQNYLDYRHQKSAGFVFDALDLFKAQLSYIAAQSVGSGGDIVFATHEGDVWQHQWRNMDPAHEAKGMKAIANPYMASELAVSALARSVESPAAKAAFAAIDGKLPFSVVPGNHDYDAMWSDSRWPPVSDPKKITGANKESIGLLHSGGLENYKSVFSDAAGGFFAGKGWYAASYNDGADSAQRFAAGGYTFLHLGLEMSPDDGVIAWAQKVIDANRGLPTIITTHDFLNTDGTRTPNPMVDMKAADPDHNNAEDLWKKLIAKNDQIFLVLCGHEHGQARRVDLNEAGHEVYQLLADYQDRGQAAVDAGIPLVPGLGGKSPVAIGDGWMRLLQFSLGGSIPSIRARTYSTYYKAFSTDLPAYASYYKPYEAKAMTDAQYLKQDDFTIALVDFRDRFGK